MQEEMIRNRKDALRDTIIEIDLGKLSKNVKMIKEMAGSDVAVMAVIKANGYGHGAWQIAQTIILL